jgi:integrase
MTKGIYKRGSVYWIRYAGLDGRTVRESSGFTKFRDAEALLIKRRNDVKEGKQPEIKRIANHSFNELAVEYLQWAERQRSYKSKKGFVRQLVELYGGLPLRRFSTRLIEQLQTERLQRGNKPATINRLVATLKHMFTKAVDWEMVEEETLKRVRKVKLLEENNRRLRYLSKKECQELIEACGKRAKYLKDIVVTALNTGMRKTEVLLLKWDNVDLKHGFILLDITKNGERREIPINDTVRETLQSLTRRLDVPYVFYDQKTGKPYGDVKRSFNSACRRAGIKDFRFHDLRHTFGTRLAWKNAPIIDIKELMGHSSVKVTERYTHSFEEQKRNAVNLLVNLESIND